MGQIGNPSYPPATPTFGILPPQMMLQMHSFSPPLSSPATPGVHAVPMATPLFTRTVIEQDGPPLAASFTRECSLFMLQPHPSASIPPQAQDPAPPAVNNETHLIVNIDSKEIILNCQQIPADPPAIHLSANINTLLWEWNNSQWLVIDGRAIHIKCWDQIYKAKVGCGT